MEQVLTQQAVLQLNSEKSQRGDLQVCFIQENVKWLRDFEIWEEHCGVT